MTNEDGDMIEQLRDNVRETLENSGIMASLRAQLRAAVYHALDEEPEKDGVGGVLVRRDFQCTKIGHVDFEGWI